MSSFGFGFGSGGGGAGGSNVFYSPSNIHIDNRGDYYTTPYLNDSYTDDYYNDDYYNDYDEEKEKKEKKKKKKESPFVNMMYDLGGLFINKIDDTNIENAKINKTKPFSLRNTLQNIKDVESLKGVEGLDGLVELFNKKGIERSSSLDSVEYGPELVALPPFVSPLVQKEEQEQSGTKTPINGPRAPKSSPVKSRISGLTTPQLGQFKQTNLFDSRLVQNVPDKRLVQTDFPFDPTFIGPNNMIIEQDIDDRAPTSVVTTPSGYGKKKDKIGKIDKKSKKKSIKKSIKRTKTKLNKSKTKKAKKSKKA